MQFIDIQWLVDGALLPKRADYNRGVKPNTPVITGEFLKRAGYNRCVWFNAPVKTGALVNAPVIVSALNHFYQNALVIVSVLKALCNFYQY